MSLRISLQNNQHATLISAYAPILDAEDDTKETFYISLSELISSTPGTDKLVILVELNARVGMDHHVWGGVCLEGME